MPGSVELFKQYNAEVRGLKTVQYRNQPAYKLDCLGHKVFLCRPQQIEYKLGDIESAWESDLISAEDRESIAWAMAKFYYDFLQIQPFADGNQRTALRFLLEQLSKRYTHHSGRYVVRANPFLRKVQLDGDRNRDLHRLSEIFFRWLQPVQ